jgi:hypothetical protein
VRTWFHLKPAPEPRFGVSFTNPWLQFEIRHGKNHHIADFCGALRLVFQCPTPPSAPFALVRSPEESTDTQRLAEHSERYSNDGYKHATLCTDFDTTLRTANSPGATMTHDKAGSLLRRWTTWRDIIEAGFPIASEGDFCCGV